MANKIRVVVSVTNDLCTDNRVNKVCLFLEKQGYRVTLVGRELKGSAPLPQRTYRTKRFKLPAEKGPWFYAWYNLRLFLYLLTHKVDVLVSNDLDTLLANYAASKCKPLVKLVYDSHEYFTEVPELVARPRVQRIWEGIEAWIFPKLKDVYTVNESIAALYREKYKKEIAVLRNCSPKWEKKLVPSKADLGIPEGVFLVLIQGAGINMDRGAEEAVAAMKQLTGCVLLIVGDGDVVGKLKEEVQQNNLSDRVRFFGKRPYEEMMAFTYHADVGLTLDKPTNLNYRFSLPNKVFDYMHAATPMICTDLVEVSRIVSHYAIGTILPELTVENLTAAIQDLQNNPEKLATMKANCSAAAVHENWEMETKVLEKIYPNCGN